MKEKGGSTCGSSRGEKETMKFGREKRHHIVECEQVMMALAFAMCIIAFVVPVFFDEPYGIESLKASVLCFLCAAALVVVWLFGKGAISTLVGTIQTICWVVLMLIPGIIIQGVGGYAKYAISCFKHLHWVHYRPYVRYFKKLFDLQ